ncbi:ABC transporter substrate-binding protein [Paenibacillus sp. GCM10023252]|uniref:ABC transporter substrate-binding protein n=1 Tax=Paenibacillus sp. GCM10023252 TaxID=3252649 RepID=UPI00360A0A98
MKKNLAIVLSMLLLMTLLAACGNSNEGPAENVEKNTAAEEQKEVKLQFGIWGDDARKKVFEDLLVKYKEKHPNVNVEVVLIPFAEYQQKLSIMMASKTAPDLVWLAERMIPQFVETNQLMDISSISEDAAYDYADLFESSMDIFRKDGKLYGVPFTSPPKVIFFNKSLFEAKGLKNPLELHKEGKWTYEEMLKAAAALTDPANGVYGLNLFGANGWKGWQDALMETIWAYGADLFSEDGTKFLLNSPEGEQVLTMLNNAIFQDKVHIKPGDQTTFESGKIAMGRYNFSYAANARKASGFEWDIAPMPQGPVTDAPTAVGLAGYAVTESTKHPKETVELLKYLTGKEVMTELSGTFVPNRKSVISSEDFLKAAEQPSAEAIQAALIDRIDGGVRVQPSHKNWQQIDVKVQTVMDYLYSQSGSVKDVLNKMEQEVTPLLK